MKNIAANIVLFSSLQICHNLVVCRNEEGVVQKFISLDEEMVEPSSTLFFNGVITPAVCQNHIVAGVCLDNILSHKLAVGYSGPLFLWRHISLTDRVITAQTTCEII